MGFTLDDVIILSLIFLSAVVLRWIVFTGPVWGRTILKLLSFAAIPTFYKIMSGTWVEETLMIVAFFVLSSICIWLVKRPTDWLVYGVKVMRGVSKTVEKKADAYALLASNGELAAIQSHDSSTATDDLYALIATELETNNLDKGLWTRLYAECEGDETKTRVRYIRERLLALSTQQPTQPTQNSAILTGSMSANGSVVTAAIMELSPRDREKALEAMIKRMQ